MTRLLWRRFRALKGWLTYRPLGNNAWRMRRPWRWMTRLAAVVLVFTLGACAAGNARDPGPARGDQCGEGGECGG